MTTEPLYSVFCDFDGTIADQDMIARIMQQFAPAASRAIIEQISARELSVRRGVEALFALLPSSRLAEIASFAEQDVVLRPGFLEFVQLCHDRAWPLHVVSGGFDFFVKPALREVEPYVTIHCNRIDATGTHLRVLWNTPCDDACDSDCGLCKPTVMRRLRKPLNQAIVIGDGVTDLRAAQVADFVFARDRLLLACRELGIRHQAFDTFYEISARMSEREIL